MITPFVGPIFEQGNLAIFNNQGRASVTRNGVGFGVNFDPCCCRSTGAVQPYAGFGGQVSAMQSVKEILSTASTSGLRIRVEARGVVRAGFFIR